MIVVDTSAVVAVLKGEPRAEDCIRTLVAETEVLISAVSLTELLMVAHNRSLDAFVWPFLRAYRFAVVPVSEEDAEAAARAHTQWGKGVHPAGLNFGDCFAYALAAQRGCPLLYVGNDFSRTDIVSAI